MSTCTRIARNGPDVARLVGWAVLLSALVAGCGRGPPAASLDAPATEASHPAESPPATALSDAERRFGVSPRRGKGVTYQPDVIVMEHGAEAIRSQDANGLTWTIDGSAPGASAIEVGKILFATGRAVGRVLKVDRSGTDLAVTLGPVELTELLEEAHVDYHGTLDPSGMIVYVGSPDYPGAMLDRNALAKESQNTPRPSPLHHASVRAYVVASDGGLVPLDPPRATLQRGECAPNARIHRDPNRLAIGCGTAGARVRFVASGSGAPAAGTPGDLAAILLGGFKFVPSFSDGLGLYAPYDEDGLRFLAHLKIKLSHPEFTFKLDILHGLKTASVELAGVGGIDVGIEGATNGGYKNIDKSFALPMDISFTIPGFVPFSATFHQSLLVQTMITGEHSEIRAMGEYQLHGKIVAGILNGSPSATAPVFVHTVQDLAHSLSGESAAVNGLVLGYGGKLIVGVGSFGLVVGPYLSVNTTLGLTNGSSLQRGVVGYVCRAAQLDLALDYGLGFAVPTWSTDALNFALSFFSAKRVDPSYSKKLGTIPIQAFSDSVPPSCAAKPA